MKPVVFAGILRLAAKYLIEPLRAHLIEQVVSDWPKTLKEWDLRQEEIQEFLRDRKHPSVHEHFPEPATAIKFASMKSSFVNRQRMSSSSVIIPALLIRVLDS